MGATGGGATGAYATACGGVYGTGAGAKGAGAKGTGDKLSKDIKAGEGAVVDCGANPNPTGVTIFGFVKLDEDTVGLRRPNPRGGGATGVPPPVGGLSEIRDIVSESPCFIFNFIKIKC